MRTRNSMSWTAIFIAAAILGLAAWHYWPPGKVESMRVDGGRHLKFRTAGEQLEIYRNGGWRPFFAKGVNLGATLPGHDPGELPIDRATYERWFGMMAEMGANVVRVYTIQKPVFYQALVKYNQKHADRPLYFIQGVWSPEEAFRETGDALSEQARTAFRKEIADAVGAVYGSVTLPERPGKASGKYTVNAAPYLVAWHIGTEWDPELVVKTNKLHRNEPPYRGRYFQAKPDASPFESMIAEMIDTVAAGESGKGWLHPQTFTNWVTTDPLTHPGELLNNEDLVSVDPTHMEPVHWQAGYFASYHVYPYYPDFFRIDPTLMNVKDGQGRPDTYRAYLRKLKAYHRGMPVMVTEFGVPSSIGLAHLGNLGRDQGGHDEKEQGQIDAALYKEIVEEHFAGAILFSWQDEWFKKTWNTMHFELPSERRKYWLNVLTNEKMFGVLGMYPGKEGVLSVDGNLDDWDKLPKDDKMQWDQPAPGWNRITVTHDEAYVYVAAELTENFAPDREILHLGIDTLPGGNRHGTAMGNRKLDEGLETMITLGNDRESGIRIAADYDFHQRLYGQRYGMIPVGKEEKADDSGVFNPWKLAVGLKLEPPDARRTYPFEEVEVGRFRRGTTDPNSPDYNTLALWQASGRVVELRIPWMLMGFTDPSSLQVMAYGGKDLKSVKTEGIRLVPWIEKRAGGGIVGLGDGNSVYRVTDLPRYRWNSWNSVRYNERPKQSYEIMKDVYHQVPPP